MNHRRIHGTLLGTLMVFSALGAPALAVPAADGKLSFQLAAAEGPLAQIPSLLKQGRFAQARQVAEQALAKDADSLDANLLMGQVLEHTGDSEGALKYFKRAADGNPESLEAQVWLGAGLLAAEKYDQAIAASEKALSKWEKKSPDKELLSRLWVNLAGAQGLKSKREGLMAMLRFGTGVRGHLEKALTIDANSRSQYALGRYFVEAPGAIGGDPKKGLPLIEKALKVEPYYHVMRANYVRGLIAAGQKAEAKEEWTRFKSDFSGFEGVMREAKDIEAKL
ncbi:tetratricopeptide repeat protein [compost metagenome]